MDYGERMRAVRLKNHKSRAETAKALNVSYPAYCHWEAGYRMPPIDRLIDFSDFFHITPNDILGYNSDLFEFNDEELEELRNFREYLRFKREGHDVQHNTAKR